MSVFYAAVDCATYCVDNDRMMVVGGKDWWIDCNGSEVKLAFQGEAVGIACM